jgi:hypothetical protein
MKLTQHDIDSEALAKVTKEHLRRSPLKNYLKNIVTDIESGKSPIPKEGQADYVAAAKGLLNSMNKGKK